MQADRLPRAAATNDPVRALRRAAVRATLAHSSRQTEPWQLFASGSVLELHAAPDRWLMSRDPTGQALTLSVGCALLNARVSLDTERWEYDVVRLPDPKHPHHLASIQILGLRPGCTGVGSDLDIGFEAAGVGLARLADREFGRHHVDDSDPRQPRPDEVALLSSAVVAEGSSLHTLGPDVVAVASTDNRAVDWLRAGEATQRLVLEAERLGLAVEEIEGAVDLPADRARLRHELGGTWYPQAVLRIGGPGVRIRGRYRTLVDILR